MNQSAINQLAKKFSNVAENELLETVVGAATSILGQAIVKADMDGDKCQLVDTLATAIKKYIQNAGKENS